MDRVLGLFNALSHRHMSTSLDWLYRERYEPLALRSRRPNTKRLYRATLKCFNVFLGRPATPERQVQRLRFHRLDDGLV